MADRHKRTPISFRPPEGDRAWLESYASETGRPVRAILTEALSRYRSREHDMSITDHDRLDADRADQLPVGDMDAIRQWTGQDDTLMALSDAYAEARELARNLAAAVRRVDGGKEGNEG